MPVAEQEEGDLVAVKKLFDEHTAVREPVRRVSRSCISIGRDENTFARGQPVGLDHIRSAIVIERGLGLEQSERSDGATGWHECLRHDALGEIFAALEHGGRLVRPKYGDTLRSNRVGHTGDERGLRANYHEVDVEANGERGSDDRVIRVDLHARYVVRNASIARSGRDVVGVVLCQEGQDDGVLASARPQNENLHYSSVLRMIVGLATSTLHTGDWRHAHAKDCRRGGSGCVDCGLRCA